MIPLEIAELLGFPRMLRHTRTLAMPPDPSTKSETLLTSVEDAARAGLTLFQLANVAEEKNGWEPDYGINLRMARHEVFQHAAYDPHLSTRGGRIRAHALTDGEKMAIVAASYEPLGRRTFSEHLRIARGNGEELSDGDKAIIRVFSVLSAFERLIGRDQS